MSANVSQFFSPILQLAIVLTVFVAGERCLGQSKFVHPGIAFDAKNIDLAKAKIDTQPHKQAWATISESQFADLKWRPSPVANVERGASNNPDIGSSEFSDDGTAAFVHALCWTMTGEVKHAEKSAEIIDAWSSKLETIGNHDARLLVGMSGHDYLMAAELLKHTWDGWPQDRQRQFEKMCREIWYPVIKDFYPTANGNWDASMLQTMIAMGVFLEDQEMFDRAKNYFIKGKGNGAIGNYFNAVGECQETGRDQAHTQMGLDFLSATCETAWIQGVDLYKELDNRLLKGFEYTASYNLGNDVPYEPFRSFEGRYHYKEISNDARGRLRPMYERVFNHYHNRLEIDAPFTWEAVEKLRRTYARYKPRRRSSRKREMHRLRFAVEAAIETLMYAQQSDDAAEAR